MTNLLERSILMTIGAAALTRDMAEALGEQLMRQGETRREDGREAVNELVEKARDETRQVKGRFDRSMERTFRDMGIATHDQLEDMELKMAQLEHRLSLIEAMQVEQAAEVRKVLEELAAQKEK